MSEEKKDSETTKSVKVNSINENYKDLQALIECLNLDMDKFQKKKVKAAGQRARNNLLNTKKLCDTLRKQIIAEIKAIPIKHRIQESEDSKGESKGEIKEETHDIKPIEILGVKTVIATPKKEGETGANGPHESHQPEPVKPKKKRTRRANKRNPKENRTS